MKSRTLKSRGTRFFVVVLMLYVPVNNFQLCQDDFQYSCQSWVELTKQWMMCLAQLRTQHSDFEES